MKSFAVMLFCLVAVSSADVYLPKNLPLSVYTELLKLQSEVHQFQEKISVKINDYLDNTMQIIQVWIIKNGMDPYEAPDMEKGFSVKLGLINFHGEFTLTHGWMQGLSSIQRGGDAYMSYEAKFLNLRLPLSFPTVPITYDYKTKIMNLGPSGGVEGKIKNLQILVDVTIDTKNLEVVLQEFSIVDAGKISIRWSGNPLVDWLSNALTGLATNLLHDLAIRVVQTQVRELVANAIDQLNEALHPKDIYLH